MGGSCWFGPFLHPFWLSKLSGPYHTLLAYGEEHSIVDIEKRREAGECNGGFVHVSYGDTLVPLHIHMLSHTNLTVTGITSISPFSLWHFFFFVPGLISHHLHAHAYLCFFCVHQSLFPHFGAAVRT